MCLFIFHSNYDDMIPVPLARCNSFLCRLVFNGMDWSIWHWTKSAYQLCDIYQNSFSPFAFCPYFDPMSSHNWSNTAYIHMCCLCIVLSRLLPISQSKLSLRKWIVNNAVKNFDDVQLLPYLPSAAKMAERVYLRYIKFYYISNLKAQICVFVLHVNAFACVFMLLYCAAMQRAARRCDMARRLYYILRTNT